AVFPCPLRLPSRHQQIAAPEMQRARLAASFGPEQELSWLSQRDQRHDGLLDLLPDPVAVPGHAVPAVPVEVEAGRVEQDTVPGAKRDPDLVEDLRLQRHAGSQVPRRREARLEDALIVHAPGALAPVARLEDLV